MKNCGSKPELPVWGSAAGTVNERTSKSEGDIFNVVVPGDYTVWAVSKSCDSSWGVIGANLVIVLSSECSYDSKIKS